MTGQADFQVRGWPCVYSRFTSAELETIADVPGPIQRLWRSRGHLPGEMTTRAAFTSRDVAEIMVRHDLSKLGVTPGDSADLGRHAAQIVLWFALLNADGAVEVTGSEQSTQSFLEEFESDGALTALLCGNPTIARYIVKASGGEPVFYPELDPYVQANKVRSAAFLDLETAGQDLATRSGRPLVRLDVGITKGARPMRRLTRISKPNLQLL